jgi:SpoVK/Ycf46/Vps4 family AAA+-type ATPase
LSLFAGGNGGIGVRAAVAHDLGLVLYHIDLAGVASKYIGETEKNLEPAFAAAERQHELLDGIGNDNAFH